jgi:hypothetical protein
VNGTASESHRAGEEARRDTISGSGRSGTDTRYDAMLRYLRGLYVRSPKTQQTSNAPKAPSQPPVRPAQPPAEPSDSDGEPPTD